MGAQKRIESGAEVIFTNVGNPQALGQPSFTFNRRVIALLSCPSMMVDFPEIERRMPTDVVERAARYRAMLSGGSVGAYTDARGVLGVRSEVAQFIEKRDGARLSGKASQNPCTAVSPDDIFLTNGASEAVAKVMKVLLRGQQDCVLVPIPQYPLYSATVALNSGELLPYFLQESSGWSLDVGRLYSTVKQAREQGKTVRAMVVINPGNPTGQCMSSKDLISVVKFCVEEGIVLLADEVYQKNIYSAGKEFTSLRPTMLSMGDPFASTLELVSFHSSSKGAMGECGLRGGYMQFENIDPIFKRELYKVLSISLSPNIIGNICIGLMVNPPAPGDPSYALHRREEQQVLSALRRRALRVAEVFNSCEGISCTPTDGALYSFPKLGMPEKAVQEARRLGKQPDTFYCLELLRETGISTVPGGGFGQEDGTYHFRTTILVPEDDLEGVLNMFKTFHANFLARFGRSKL